MMNFRQYTNATKIYIGDKTQLSTTNFSNAFRGMANLKEIRIPNSVNITFSLFM